MRNECQKDKSVMTIRNRRRQHIIFDRGRSVLARCERCSVFRFYHQNLVLAVERPVVPKFLLRICGA